MQEIIEQLRDAEVPSDELDILVWLTVGERLGVPQTDSNQRILIADRDRRHFVPSATWNGRDLQAALDWCREHNRDEIARVAHDWGVPRFTASLDAARMLLGSDRIITGMSEDDRSAYAEVSNRVNGSESEAVARLLPCALCAAALDEDPEEDSEDAGSIMGVARTLGLEHGFPVIILGILAVLIILAYSISLMVGGEGPGRDEYQSAQGVCTDESGDEYKVTRVLLEGDTPLAYSFFRNGTEVTIKSPEAPFEGEKGSIEQTVAYQAFHLYDCELTMGDR